VRPPDLTPREATLARLCELLEAWPDSDGEETEALDAESRVGPTASGAGDNDPRGPVSTGTLSQ
jgi:hypothetical protein